MQFYLAAYKFQFIELENGNFRRNNKYIKHEYCIKSNICCICNCFLLIILTKEQLKIVKKLASDIARRYQHYKISIFTGGDFYEILQKG